MNYRKNIRIQSRLRARRKLRYRMLTILVIIISAVGLIGMSAGATPPVDKMERAQKSAERAAASENALRTLREKASEVTASDASTHAMAVFNAASVFGTLDFPSVPQDWVAAGLDLTKATREGDKLVQRLPDGGKVVFTIEPDTQNYLERMMRENRVPHGSIVLMDPPTGRVIAMASYSEHTPRSLPLAQNGNPPSASVFKIITAAALMESAGVADDMQVCYHGGTRGLTQRNILGDARLDNKCNDLGGALVWSINSLIAKLAHSRLSKQDLQIWAERFGYNTEIPFELPLEVSRAEIVDDPFERARAAAGFWHTHLTPIHGAMIGATLANDGIMMQPSIIESYESPQGEVLYSFEPKVFRRVMSPQTAKKIGSVMEETARGGTARRYFGQRRDFPRDIVVSGKTGTLSFQDPFLRNTWFVGYAQHELFGERGVAIGSLMQNTPQWRIVGPQAASNALKKYYQVTRQRHSQEHEVATR